MSKHIVLSGDAMRDNDDRFRTNLRTVNSAQQQQQQQQQQRPSWTTHGAFDAVLACGFICCRRNAVCFMRIQTILVEQF